MSVEKAVWRLTGELADWFGIDAGRIRSGSQADLVILDPNKLDDSLETVHEKPLPKFSEHSRLVRRNDETIKQVFVNGKLVVNEGQPLKWVGKDKPAGRFLESKLFGAVGKPLDRLMVNKLGAHHT